MITKGMNGAEAVLRVLRAMGVEKIFASPGSDWAPLWEALAKPYEPGEVPEYISSRHEETAAAMAMGYAKVTGKLPALVVHTTVGALHATMALRAALHERIPMVVMAGESVTFAEAPLPELGRQWLRLLTDVGGPARLVESCVKWSFGMNTSLLLPHTMQRACQLAMAAPRGPVFVSVPLEFMLASMTTDPPAVAAHASAPAAQPAAIEALARELAAASNPVIVTEEVGKSVAAVAQLVALAETLGAPVVEAWQPTYVNFPRAHPLYCGVAAVEMAEVLKGADLVFLVESVGPWHPPSALPAPGTRVVVLGEDPLHAHLPFWGFQADLVVAGEAEASLAMLVGEVRKTVSPGSRAAAIERWRSRNEQRRATTREAARVAGTRDVIETSWVVHELDAVLPDDAIVVDETITHRADVLRLFDRLTPGRYFEASYGGLGMGIGMALGVKAAHPDRIVVNTIGDGTFHYNPVLGSFGAAQEHRLPILVVLFDNAGYRSQKGDVINEYPEGWAVKADRFVGTSITPRPDYALLARAYGGYGETVTGPGEVRAALARGLQAVAKGQFALITMVLEPVNPREVR
ncbi:MAG: thiamine pyrophosphate-dependent enzyme [Betaproteobacteria bacterium]|jgi:acetolactate synthase-1/2/3 large subunit|nr:thiamine pyrophosphate-dependent enzyme [Betaproteobacteria bacterium]